MKNTVKYYAAGLLLALPFGVLSVVLVFVGYSHTSEWFFILALLAAVPCVYVTLRALVPFFRMLYYVRKVDDCAAMFLTQSGCSVFQGALGAGKSSLAGYILVLISGRLWAQLQTDYLTMSVYVRDWRKVLAPSGSPPPALVYWQHLKALVAAGKITHERARLLFSQRLSRGATAPHAYKQALLQRERWDEVKQAYRYYASHPDRVPCLFSNIPLQVGRLKVSRLTVEHLLQKKRLPAYTAVYADELGHLIDKWLVTERNDDTDALAELFRFFWQFFGNGTRFIGTEQDSSNVLKDMRRVMVSNEYILGQERILQPRLLLWLLDRKRRRLYTHMPSRPAVDKYKRFETLVKSIGFRRYRYVSLGNTEHDFGSQETVTVYTPAALNYTYYDRTFERLYRCRQSRGRITADAFDTDTVPPDTQRLRSMGVYKFVPTSGQTQDAPARARPLSPWIRPGHNARKRRDGQPSPGAHP